MKQCPRCASEIGKKDKVCPRCGIPVDKMEFAEQLEEEAKSPKLNRAQKKEKKRLAKLERKEAKRQKKLERAISPTDFSKYATTSRVPKGRKKINDGAMHFELDENGEFHIDTSDVEIIGAETIKILDEKREQTYSVKKARGDYRPPRIKWWEIYKIADRSFARRKIKKEVNKAGRIKPENVNKWKLFFLCLFFGWFGVHNFYAKNKKKGAVSLTCISIACVSMMLSSLAWVQMFQYWLVGFTGFVAIFLWVGDLVNILFNKFSYRIQKDKFISCMNVTTRAKLGEKYIDLDLLKKPWWVRLTVWWRKKRNNYKEWQRERRQYLIEKEKKKLAAKEEKEKLEKEIADFEEKENKKFEEEKRVKKLQELSEDVVEEKEEVKEDAAEEKAETQVVEEPVEEKAEKPAPKTKKTSTKAKTSSKTKAEGDDAKPEKKTTKASASKSKYGMRNNTKKKPKKK